MMKLSLAKAAALMAVAVLACATTGTDAQSPAPLPAPPGAKKPCLESGGVAIFLNGNFGFCYLKGRRMRPESIFAQCRDGKLTCYTDEGIPDKPRKETPCIAPEPGFCGSDQDATPPPNEPSVTPSVTPSATPSATLNSSAAGSGIASDVDDTEVGDEDISGDNAITDGPNDEVRDDDDDEDEDGDATGTAASTETRDAKPEPTINPSALVAGNLPNGEVYDEDEEYDEGLPANEADGERDEDNDQENGATQGFDRRR